MTNDQASPWKPGDEVFHEDFGNIYPGTVKSVDPSNGWVTLRPHDRPEDWRFMVPPYHVWSPEDVRMCAGCGRYLVEENWNGEEVYWGEIARCERCGPIVWVCTEEEFERLPYGRGNVPLDVWGEP